MAAISDQNSGAVKDLNALVTRAQFEDDIKNHAGLDKLKDDAKSALDAILPIDKREGSNFITEAASVIGSLNSSDGEAFLKEGGTQLSAPSRENPIEAATAFQNENLRGSSAGAPLFNRSSDNSPVIQPTDIHQDIAHEGDCQTMSALASVAQSNPSLLQDHIKSAGDDPDHEGATLYDVQVFAEGQWTTQRVSDFDLPGKGSLQQSDVIWPRLYEAAIIKAYPDYDVLNQGRADSSQQVSGLPMMWSAIALNALTGKDVLATNATSGADDLLGAVARGQAATAGITLYDGVLGDFGTFKTIDPQTGQIAAKDDPNAVTLLGNHQYSVLGVTGDAPNRQVQLFNPYNYPGNGGSKLTVSEAVFRQYFSDGCVTE